MTQKKLKLKAFAVLTMEKCWIKVTTNATAYSPGIFTHCPMHDHTPFLLITQNYGVFTLQASLPILSL